MSDELEPEGYPVLIVGEQHRQDAIRLCHVGDPVKLLREPGNPHDPQAIAVEDMRGATLGYIARKSFVQRAVHKENKGITARILRISGGGPELLGVTLDVVLEGDPVGERAFKR